MITSYSNEKAIQILISLLKQHGIKRVIASPGATNITFVGSIMQDDWFEIYSCVDERSAAYMAVGMAEESGEPVVLSCTGATASRNYLPGITEAFYRKLPILSITSTQDLNRLGHLIPQVIDRTVNPIDTYVESQHISFVHDSEDEWDCSLKINRAILALKKNGGGPSHINLTTHYSTQYDTVEISKAKKINLFDHSTPVDELPDLPVGRIGIRVGNHLPWSEQLTEAVDTFCDKTGAVVFCELGSNYAGNHRVYSSILSYQEYGKELYKTDLIIHIGETGAYGNESTGNTSEVWRVNEDGALRDTMKKLTAVFQMSELSFFKAYCVKTASGCVSTDNEWLQNLRLKTSELLSKIPDLPFSNLWIAQHTAYRLPKNSCLHAGILNSHRAWTIFELPESIRGKCFVNTGGFGIDGCMSSAIGGAIINPDIIHFLVLGDLAFFYDLNSIGNRHITPNLRIILINNGKGTEFKNYNHAGALFDNSADLYIAAGGHFGNKSRSLVHDIALASGFDYLSASSKDEYLSVLDRLVSPEISHKPLLIEVFTNDSEESEALKIINTLQGAEDCHGNSMKHKIKSMITRLR